MQNASFLLAGMWVPPHHPTLSYGCPHLTCQSGLLGMGATSTSPEVQAQFATYVKESLRGNNDLKFAWHQHCRLYAEVPRPMPTLVLTFLTYLCYLA